MGRYQGLRVSKMNYKANGHNVLYLVRLILSFQVKKSAIALLTGNISIVNVQYYCASDKECKMKTACQ